MPNLPATSDPFATAMQQLSAEAEKSLPTVPAKIDGSDARSEQALQFNTLSQRLIELERSVSAKIENLVAALSQTKGPDWSARLQQIDEQLIAIRSTESVNQRLFDSLHEELLTYRDNFLHESLQKPFIHDLVHLFDDLSSLAGQLQSSAEDQKGRGHIGQWCDNLENAIHSLMEILHRFEVNEIEVKENVDRALHKVINFEPADFPEEDGRIVMRVKRGFFWRGRLIRPEEVIAKRYG